MSEYPNLIKSLANIANYLDKQGQFQSADVVDQAMIVIAELQKEAIIPAVPATVPPPAAPQSAESAHTIQMSQEQMDDRAKELIGMANDLLNAGNFELAVDLFGKALSFIKDESTRINYQTLIETLKKDPRFLKHPKVKAIVKKHPKDWTAEDEAWAKKISNEAWKELQQKPSEW